MAALSAEKLKEMEAEMNRFEQEIALPVLFPPQAAMMPSRPVIGANTYSRIAEQLQKQQRQMEQQTYSLGAMVGLYPEASVMPVELVDQGPPLQFIPHQLQMQPPSGPPPNMMGPPPMDVGGPNMMNMPPPGSMEEMMQGGPGGHGSSFMPPNSYGPSGNEMMQNNMRMMQPPSPPAPPTLMASPAVYAAPPVKMHKIVEKVQLEIPIPVKPEIREPQPPPEPLPPIVLPPLPVKKVPPVIPFEDSSSISKKKEKERRKKCIRTAGGQTWEDTSLMEWEYDDFRIFCGDLGNDVTDEVLTRAFSKYPSFIRSKVIRDKRNNKTKGYGFVSFKDPQDFIKAMREMNGKYVGSRPIKLRKSTWRDRNLETVRKKQKEKTRLGLR